MLTTMISTIFALCAVLGMAVIAGSLRHALPRLRDLRRQLRTVPETMTLRTTVTTVTITRASATVYRPAFAGSPVPMRHVPALRAA